MMNARAFCHVATVLASAFILTACASLSDNQGRITSSAIGNNGGQSLAKVLFQGEQIMPENQSGFMILDNGLDAFVARIVMARKAQHSIDLVTFIFKNDLIGRTVLNEFMDAANRGVRVRLLLDDLWLGDHDELFAAFDAHPNIEIRMFNPLKRGLFQSLQYITRFGSVTRRMHNKSFIVDNQAAVIGGRNIGGEYFDDDPDIDFGDFDALTIGPVVAELSNTFDIFWNSKLSYPVTRLAKTLPSVERVKKILDNIKHYVIEHQDSPYAKALRESELVRALTGKDDIKNKLRFLWGNARVLADSPQKISSNRDRTDLSMAGSMTELFAKSTKELIIFTPYFIPQKKGAQGLIDLEKRGTHIRILTNSLSSNNHKAVHAHYAKYRKKLLQAGIEIYELRSQKLTGDGRVNVSSKEQVLHAKLFVFDRKYSFIGSLNFDPRSWVENTEIGAVFENEEFAAGIAQWFDKNFDKLAYRLKLDDNNSLVWVSGDGSEYYKEPNTSFWERFTTGLYRWLPIESQL